MKIRHKHTKQEIGGSYHYWKNEILKKHLEINYEILTKPDLVDVYEINKDNGNHTFIETIDRFIAKDRYLKKDNKYTIQDTDINKFDELYRPIKKYNALKINQKIPSIKRIIEKSINSKISKEIWIIIRTVFCLLIAYTVWALFNEQIIYWIKFLTKNT
ncbi:hypothetical protein ACWGOQ_0023680 [Aquimarina sp. M1]